MTWLLVPAALYVALAALLWALQDRMIFPGAAFGRGSPVPDVPGVRVERLALPAGGTFRVAIAEPEAPPAGVVVAFLGNGEDLRSAVHWAALWADYGQATLAVEYPGYGDSDGEPGEAAFYAAAEAAAEHARRLAPGLPLTASGSSLGSFSAVHLAASGLADRLVLFAPPRSTARVGRERYPWLPIAWLLRHRFDNEARAADVRCPALIVHGDRDGVVPLAHGVALSERFAGPTELRIARGFGHNDLPLGRHGPFGEAIARFLGGGG